ncbi:MAG: hypothetical protein IK034_02505, partial [Bacilli bacterium]|nr:hypothetical protein [Bacilli bacterium]
VLVDDVYLYNPEPEVAKKTVYFVPNDNWKSDNATFAVYAWKGETNSWITGTDKGDYIQFDLPVDLDGFVFVRLKPSTAEGYDAATNGGLNWTNKWNQTVNLTVPADANVVFAITGGEGDTYTGTWSAVPNA